MPSRFSSQVQWNNHKYFPDWKSLQSSQEWHAFDWHSFPLEPNPALLWSAPGTFEFCQNSLTLRKLHHSKVQECPWQLSAATPARGPRISTSIPWKCLSWQWGKTSQTLGWPRWGPLQQTSCRGPRTESDNLETRGTPWQWTPNRPPSWSPGDGSAWNSPELATLAPRAGTLSPGLGQPLGSTLWDSVKVWTP